MSGGKKNIKKPARKRVAKIEKAKAMNKPKKVKRLTKKKKQAPKATYRNIF